METRPGDRIVRTSISLGVRENVLWSAAAHLSGVDKNAFAVEAILRACNDRGVILVDKRNPKGKRKSKDQDEIDDRQDVIGEITPDGPESAA